MSRLGLIIAVIIGGGLLLGAWTVSDHYEYRTNAKKAMDGIMAEDTRRDAAIASLSAEVRRLQYIKEGTETPKVVGDNYTPWILLAGVITALFLGRGYLRKKTTWAVPPIDGSKVNKVGTGAVTDANTELLSLIKQLLKEASNGVQKTTTPAPATATATAVPVLTPIAEKAMKDVETLNGAIDKLGEYEPGSPEFNSVWQSIQQLRFNLANQQS